jgi:hypothetical protein
MGEVISAKAEVARVDEHIHTAYNRAVARKEEIEAAAVARLGPSVAAIDSAAALLKSAVEAENAAWEIVLVVDGKADVGIGTVRDAMWGALGRPKQSAHMDEVYPGGIGTYTSGDPCGQPLLMKILISRILAASAPQWTDVKRKAWADEIEALRDPYVPAVEAFRATEAAKTIADAAYRAAVRTGHARLRGFKRDLQNLGLTETQIHEVIPDAGAGRSRSGGGGGGSSGGGEGGATGSEGGGGTPK